jgi:site-specific recombinase XerC
MASKGFVARLHSRGFVEIRTATRSDSEMAMHGSKPTKHEAKALVAVVPSTTWHGRRDRTLLMVAVRCDLRVSELIGLRRGRHRLRGAHVRCMGKGRKERWTPLRLSMA